MRTVHELYKSTTEPVTVAFTEVKLANGKERHSYKVLEPSRLAGVKQGVTSTFDILAKPELIQWAANKAVEAMDNGVPSAEAKYAHRTLKEAAGDIGTRVHYWIEQHLAGKDLDYTKDMEASILGYLSWEKKYKPVVHYSERVVYSKKYDYAGKTDLGCRIGKYYGIVDFKTGSCDKEYNQRLKRYTGSVRARTEHFVQDAGYDLAIAEEDGQTAQFYGVLYIPVDGKVEYFQTEDVLASQEVFINTLETRRLWAKAKLNNIYRRPTRRKSARKV